MSFSHTEFLLVPTFPSGCLLSAAQLGQAARKVVTAAASHRDISLMIVFKPTVVSAKDGLFTQSVETRSAMKVQLGGFRLLFFWAFISLLLLPQSCSVSSEDVPVEGGSTEVVEPEQGSVN